MKSSNFFTGLSWLLILNAIVKPVWIFAIDRQVQIETGYEAYGTYFAILSLSVVLSILSDAGLNNLLNRELALKNVAAIPSFLRIKFLLSLAYMGILFLVCRLSGIQQWDLILLCGLLQVLTSFLIFFRAILTGMQLFRTDAWISVTDKLLMIIVCGSLLYLPFARTPFSITDFLFIQTGSTTAAILVSIVVFFKKGGSFSGPVQKSKRILISALPFLLLIFLMGFHNRFDAFLLQRLHPQGSYEAGLYASAFRFLDAGNTAGYLAASFLLPFAARHLGDRPLLDQTVIRIRHLLMVPAILALAFTAVYSREIMELLYGRSGSAHAQMLVYCVAVLPAYYFLHIYGTLLTAKGLLLRFAAIITACVLINLVLNMTFIPFYGALACGFSAVVSQYIAAFICYYSGSRSTGIETHKGSLFAYLACGLVVLLLLYGARALELSGGFVALLFLLVAAMIMFVFIRSSGRKLYSFK